MISSSKYNAYSEPWFNVFDILDIYNQFSLICLKFVYKFQKTSCQNTSYHPMCV